MQYWRPILLAFFAIAGLSGGSGSTTLPPGCNARLVAASQRLPAGYKARSGYCDGTVSVPHSGELAVVSYTVGPVTFVSPTSLLVSVPTRLPVALLGQDVRTGKSYRLDGVIPHDGLAIDLAAAAIPNGISAQTLGLLAWTAQPSGEPLYRPVLTGAPASSPLQLVLRSDQAALRIGWQTCIDARCSDMAVQRQGLPDGGLLTIPLVRRRAATLVTVKVTALHARNAVSGAIIDVMVPAA